MTDYRTGPFDTPIPADQRDAYMQWMMQQAAQRTRPPMLTPPTDSGYDYDNQGAFLKQMKLAPDSYAYANLLPPPPAANGHGSDQFKKPNHPTFSDQSQYNGVAGNVGGHWGDKNYTPSATNLGYRSPDQLQQYFNRVEPDIQLLIQGLRKGNP